MILDSAEGIETRAELASVLTTVFDRVAPIADVVLRADAAAAGGYDAALWDKLNGEVGIAGLTVPEDLGGAGATWAEALVLAEVVGRRSAALPYLGTLLAVEALAGTGGTAAERWLEPLMSGESTGAVSWANGLTAVEAADGWTVSGSVDLVVDGSLAGVLAVPATSPHGAGWFAVDLANATRRRQDALDLTRDLAVLELADAPALLIAAGQPDGLAVRLRDLAVLALAVEQLGVAEQAVEDAVAYARAREQFGRTIGSFQAVKHLLADLVTEADLARSLVEHATWAAVESPEQLTEAAAMAMIAASGAAVTASAENVQVHGGIGFSWEHPAHLHFRKARSNEVLLDPPHVLADKVLAPHLARVAS
jgi:alkylation response protein AidB-like acyl-CoA dehydrogenase